MTRSSLLNAHGRISEPYGLVGVEDLVVSLVAKGLTTGEVAAHLAEIYGAEVSRQAISTITDRVLEGLAPGSRARRVQILKQSL